MQRSLIFLNRRPDLARGFTNGIILGAAFGVAISAGVFATLNVGQNITWMEGVIPFVGRQDNVVIRQAATIALGVNLLMIVMAIVSIMITIPKSAGKLKKISKPCINKYVRAWW